MIKRYRIISVLLIVCLLSLVCGCGADIEDTDSAAEEEVTYNLPLLLPLTGEISNLGEDALWAAEYAVDEINRSGGIHGIPVKIELYDSQNSESQVKKYAKEIAENNRFFIGPIDSVGTAAEAEIISDTGTPNIAAYSFESLRLQAAPYGISYMSDSTDDELEAVREWKERNPDIEKVAIVVTKGETAQMETSEALKVYLNELNMSTEAVVEMNLTENEGLNAVTEALNATVDGYVVLARSEEYVKFVSEIRKRGVTEGRRITASFASNDYNMFRQNRTVMEGTYIWNMFDVEYQGEEWQKLLQAYRDDHDGQDPSTNITPDIYNAVYAWKQCLDDLDLGPVPDDLKADKEEIAEWFAASPVINAIQGDYQWLNGSKKGQFYYFQIDENGVPRSLN